jgi:CubicO group peptidase (beta-lactamase class C family)
VSRQGRDRELGLRVNDAVNPIRDYLVAEVRRGAMPGVTWWVGDARGAIATGAAGATAIGPDATPLTTDVPFDLASLTKPLATALLATILDSEGRLSLETPMGSLFPELRASPFCDATLRDAAAHRAGFPAWAALYLTGNSRDAYVNAIATCTRQGEPGATLYSDLGYILLGFAVEKASGTTLDRLFAERVARPLGLARCGFAARTGTFSDAAATEQGNVYERTLAGSAAGSHHVRGEIPRGQVHDGNAWGLGGVAGNAGLFGAARDVAAIAMAILDPTRLGLQTGALDSMLRPVVEGAGIRTVGFLLAKDAESVRGVLPDDAIGHLGFTGTSLWIDATRPRVYVLLTNRVHPQVPPQPFTATRRGFHALAIGL